MRTSPNSSYQRYSGITNTKYSVVVEEGVSLGRLLELSSLWELHGLFGFYAHAKPSAPLETRYTVYLWTKLQNLI